MSLFDTLSGFLTQNSGNILGGAAALGATNAAVNQGQNQLQDISSDLTARSGFTNTDNSLASQIQGSTEFKPFTVTTGAGTASLDGGNLNITPSGLQTGLQNQASQMLSNASPTADVTGLQQQAFNSAQGSLGANTGAFASGLGGLYGAMGEQQVQQAGQPSNLQYLQNLFADQGMTQQSGSLGGLTGQLQQAASGALGGATPTAQSVYDQIRATQSPEEERQRLALENRLAAQGRLGVQTDMYGGTPEQFAMDKAQAEARNSASLQAMSMADQLATSQQSRASQLAQLGMSAEQIDSQLANEGLARQAQSASTAGSLADTASGISAREQQLGQGLLGLGLQAQQLGGQLGQQDIQNAATMFGIGQGATSMPYQEQAMQLENISSALTASGIPLQQQLAMLTPAIQNAQLAQAGQLAETSAISQLGSAELGLLKELGLGSATLDQELIKAIGNVFAGSGTPQQTTQAAQPAFNVDLGGMIDSLLGDSGQQTTVNYNPTTNPATQNV